MTDPKPLILIVDDEFDSRLYLSDLLREEGYRVISAGNGFDALELLAQERPGIVISDVRMPEMDGIELLRRIKGDSPGTHVLLLSVYADWPMFLGALAQGCEDVLPKPFRNEDFLRAVSRVLVASSP
jgi:CheY-like chemotaxis protein